MSREGVDLYNVPQTIEGVWQAINMLRQDFDAHNHDGSSSRSFQTLTVETLIARSATIGGFRLFEAVVGPNNSDYKTVAAALNAGKTRIFVRNGTYSSEPKWQITNANTIITGESLGGVIITFAQDAVNNRSIYVNATRAIFENLKLTSYETGQQTLFNFGASGSYPTVRSCILRNQRGKVFDGASLAALYGMFSDLYIDCTAALDASLMKGFYTVSNSIVFNVTIDMNFNSAAFNPVDTCANTHFIGCSMRMNAAQSSEFTISASDTCFFNNCYFYVYQIQPNALFDHCFIESNGNAPSGYLVSITTAAMQFNNNRIKGANSINIFTITAANVQANNNYFDGGKAMVFEPSGASILGIQFCDNQWVSGYTVAAMDLRLGSAGHVTDKANVCQNIIRNNSNSFTPTITDNSTGVNKTDNQLIQG